MYAAEITGVSAVAAGAPVRSVVNVDQSLKLGSFKTQLAGFEAMLRDPATFPEVIDGLFALLGGEMIDAEEVARVNGLRTPEQPVVRGVWDLVFSLEEPEIARQVFAETERGKIISFEVWTGGEINGRIVEIIPEPGRDVFDCVDYTHDADCA